MKPETHPEWYPEAKVIYNGEVIMTVGSTQPEIIVDIWSGTHPFYTGQSRLIDTEGQVDRFMRRLRRRNQMEEEREASKEPIEDPRSRPVSTFDIGDRSENALTAAELTTVGEVLDLYVEGGDDALLAIRSIGQTAVIGIKRYLRGEGLIE